MGSVSSQVSEPQHNEDVEKYPIEVAQPLSMRIAHSDCSLAAEPLTKDSPELDSSDIEEPVCSDGVKHDSQFLNYVK